MKSKKIEKVQKNEEPKKIPLSALHWTNAIEFDLPKPGPGSALRVEGWSFNLYRVLHGYGSFDSSCVEATWSTSISHGIQSSPHSGTQQGTAQFSTKVLALRALRCALENWAAEKLDQIDQSIAREMKEPTP